MLNSTLVFSFVDNRLPVLLDRHVQFRIATSASTRHIRAYPPPVQLTACLDFLHAPVQADIVTFLF